MDAAHTVRHDHAIIRSKLTLLESTIQSASRVRGILREQCGSLQRLLQEHMQREQGFLDAAGHSRTAHPTGAQPHDHSSAYQLLRGAHELLRCSWKVSMPQVILRLCQTTEQLRAEMVEQERTVFTCGTAVSGEEAPPQAVFAISGWMSVNEILQLFPTTGAVFEQLHVNRVQEGYESLDEIAWRHGVDASEVIQQLRQFLT